MRQRFTGQARRAVILAHQEARVRGHDRDGTRCRSGGDHRVLHGLVDRRCAGSSPQRGPAGLHTNRPTRSTGAAGGSARD